MNLDTNKFFSQQLDPNEHDAEECVGLTIADILGNKLDQLVDPDFSYSLGFYIRGLTPSDTGIDPFAAVSATIAYGALPVSLETWNAKTTSALYSANFLNFTPQQVAAALKLAQNGFKTLSSVSDYANYLSKYKMGALLGMKWYPEFLGAGESLPIPTTSNFSEHAVAVYDYDPMKGLLIKPWLGSGYGNGGYSWMSESVFNLTYQSGYGFTSDSYRWISLVNIWLAYPASRSYVWPQILNGGKV